MNSRFDIIEHLIILLSAILAGMIAASFYMKRYNFHGPNAKKFISKIYHDKKTNKCYKFGIILLNNNNDITI
jgi:hypothetical protein